MFRKYYRDMFTYFLLMDDMLKLLLLKNARTTDMSHLLENISVKGFDKLKVLIRMCFPSQAATRQVYNVIIQSHMVPCSSPVVQAAVLCLAKAIASPLAFHYLKI